jgi:hypothetical protein
MNPESPSSVFDAVTVATLGPNDVVLYRVPGTLTAASRTVIVDMLNEVFPNHESIILEGGQDIAILRPKSGWLRRLFARE